MDAVHVWARLRQHFVGQCPSVSNVITSARSWFNCKILKTDNYATFTNRLGVAGKLLTDSVMVTNMTTPLLDLFTLALAERFDLVLGGSHFVDDADPARREALYATCARHVAADGAVLLERYDPDWVADPATYGGTAGPVQIDFEVLRRDGDDVDARLVYRLAGRSWTQEFRFTKVTPASVDAEARAHGLTVVAVHGDDDTWLELRPIP